MTTISNATNPATRLNKILLAAREINSRHHVTSEPISFKNAWCLVFQIEDPDSDKALVEVMHRLLELRKLFSDTENAIKLVENASEDLFVAPIRQTGGVVSNLNVLYQPWSQYAHYLSDKNLTALTFVEHALALNAVAVETEIPDEEIKSILDEVDGLYEQILESALPSDLKRDLLDLLEEFEQSMEEYRIRGAVRIKQAIAKSIGVLATNKEAVAENNDSDEIKKLSAIISQIDNAYSGATKMQSLMQVASGVLPALIGRTN